MELRENPCGENRVAPCRNTRTGGHDEADGRFCCYFTNTPKIDAGRRVICPCGSQRDGDCFPVTALNGWCHEEALCFL